MDIDNTTDTTTTAITDRAARMDAFAARFEKEDAASGADEVDDTDDTDDSSDRSEHTDEDTDDQSDGAGGESGEDSEDDDAEDTGTDDDDDASDAESDDDAEDDEADSDDEVGEETDDDDDALASTKAALAKAGAELTLDDVPEKFRPIVAKKLKSIDAAFTRVQMEQTAFRTERRQMQAEKKYAAENQDLVIVDLLRKGGEPLLERVNKLYTRLTASEDAQEQKDAATLFDERIEMQRRRATEAVDTAEKATRAIYERADQIETYARTVAKKADVPFGATIEKLLALAVQEKPQAEWANGLTNAEIDTIVGDYAKEHFRSVRAHRREASRTSVQRRTAERAKPKPTVKTPSGTTAPGVRRPAKEKVDHNDPESRLRALDRSARRILAGTK